MNIVIHIYPRSAGAWSIISPIKELAAPSHLIFFAGSPLTATTGTVVAGRLMDISNISRSVGILENRGLEDKDFKGVGGVAKTSDFDITLSNHDNMINPFKLLDSIVKVCVLPDGASSFNYADVNCIFQGYIREVPTGNFDITLTVADPVNRKLNDFVGTEIVADQIVPINYGDFTVNDNCKMAAVYNNGKVYVDSEELTEISNLHVFDDTLKEFYSYDGDIVANSNKNEIDLVLPGDNIKLYDPLVDTTSRLISLYNPYSRAYLPSIVPSISVGDVYSYTIGVTTMRIKCLALKDGYLVFEDPHSHNTTYPAPSETGTLTLISGSGTSSIPYSFVSEPISQLLTYEADSYTTDVGDQSLPINDSGRSVSLSSPAQRCLVQIDNEVIQIARHGVEVLDANNQYSFTAYYGIRGVNGTKAATHGTDAVCSVVKEDDSFEGNDLLSDLYSKNKFVFSHIFNVEKAAGFTCLDTDGTIIKTTTEFSFGDLNRIGQSSPIEINSLSTIAGGTPGNVYDYGSLFFEIKFPKVSLNATVVNMFFQGKVEFDFEDIDTHTNTLTATLHLLLSKGGLVIPKWLAMHPGHVGNFMLDANLIHVGSTDGFVKYVISLDPDVSYPCLWFSNFETGLWRGVPLANPVINGPTLTAIASELRQTTGNDPTQVIRRQWFDTTVAGRTPTKAYTLTSYQDELPNGLLSDLSDLGKTKYFLIIQRENIAGTSVASSEINQSIFLSSIGFNILFAVDLSTTPVYISGKGRSAPGFLPLSYPQNILSNLLTKEYGFSSVIAYDCWKTWQTFDFNTTLSVNGPRRKLFDTLVDFCKKHCLILSTDRLGNILLQSCLPEMANPLDEMTYLPDQITLTDGVLKPVWSQSWNSVDGLIKKLTLKYAKRTTDGVYTESCESAEYTSEYGATNEVVLEHPNVIDDTVAEWLVEKLVDFYRKPIRTIKTQALCSYYQIGSWCTITSNLIPNTVGNHYLLVATEDYLPVEQEPYTELTLLELNEQIIEESTSRVDPDILETSGGMDINETDNDHTFVES